MQSNWVQHIFANLEWYRNKITGHGVRDEDKFEIAATIALTFLSSFALVEGQRFLVVVVVVFSRVTIFLR